MYLIVYGTLKRFYGNNHILRNAKFLESREFEIDGCQLRANNDSPFPYLYKKKNQRSYPFKGEIYFVDKKTIDATDRLEGHPDFYQRVFIKKYNAWVYIYTHADAEHLETIYDFR